MFIPVHDPAEALGFYRDVLGLEVRNDVKRGEFRWVTVGARGQDLDVVLSQPHGGRSQEDGDVPPGASETAPSATPRGT
ncbi:MAG: VOC family protein [Acidimicrobiales bacterium]